MMRDEQHPTMNELEQMLTALPREMHFPPTPDIASRIVDVLPERRLALRHRRELWYALAAAAILLIVLTAALPGPRRAVADFFGLPGIRIELFSRDASDRKAPTEIGSTLLFGERTTLDEAQDAVPFAIEIPQLQPTRTPDEVYLRTADGIVAVSLLYRADDQLPEIGQTGIGMLLMEFRSTGNEPFLAKRAMGDGMFLITMVDGRDAYWIRDGELIVQSPDLGESESSGFARRSGNVLIWSDGATTFRLETMLDRDAAIAIAESMRPYQAPDAGTFPEQALYRWYPAPGRSGIVLRQG